MNQQDKYRSTQDAFAIIDRLGPLLSVPHADEETRKIVNDIFQSLLTNIIKPSIQETSVKAAGIHLI